MKLILATESQPVVQALQSIKSMTREAAENICNKYSQTGTMVGFAEARVLSLEDVSMHSWREREGNGQIEGLGGREGNFCCCQIKADLECHLFHIHKGSLAPL